MPTRNLPGTTDRRIDALLTLLSDKPLIVISGQKIAREIGVSRSSVWHWTQRLRALGVRVKGHARTGYQIERVPDVLSPSLLRRQLHNSVLGKHIHHYFKAASTNKIAFDRGHAGDPHGTVVIAEEQTAGRGRAGRAWHSEKTSGIYVTVLLRPSISPILAPLITMVAGLAVRDAVLEETGLAPDLRWPNDLLMAGKKFCGILTEMHAEPDRVRFVIVGMGVDVNHASMPAALSGIATSLRMVTGRTHSRLQILTRLLRKLETYYNRFVAEGPAPILARFTEVSSYARGKRVRITTGADTYTGTTEGLDPSGLLRVRRDDGRCEVVISGDVAEAP
jgi:BirA family transcriptional regulator, biotin operon repressor / biotin---[acetyl-CoA-carboxylase] ligase